ncbi:MAG: Riboflavin biosynthesis protein RibD [Pedosphaera sp.]|nr:Riboflavin biosynthesis protein RibD [Pedosphaera sp.]
MVGAVLVKGTKVIGQGWHHRAGEPHAEIEALRDAAAKGNDPAGAILYVTLEPCSTHGRTPPCTEAILAARIKKVVVGATDPNPAHSGEGFRLLRRKGIEIVSGILAEEAALLNEAFNHWILHQTPLVTVKAAMTLDGKIATASGESKWITGAEARAYGMKLRHGADAVFVGVNTVLADDPGLTVRGLKVQSPKRRIILDSQARTPLSAKVVADEFRKYTTVVVTRSAPGRRVAALAKRVNVWVAPERDGKINLPWLMKKLGAEQVTSILVEGGGEVNASFLLGGHAHRVAFFYAPLVLGGRDARKGVAGEGVQSLAEMVKLRDVEWRRLGRDLLLTARVS